MQRPTAHCGSDKFSSTHAHTRTHIYFWCHAKGQFWKLTFEKCGTQACDLVRDFTLSTAAWLWFRIFGFRHCVFGLGFTSFQRIVRSSSLVSRSHVQNKQISCVSKYMQLWIQKFWSLYSWRNLFKKNFLCKIKGIYAGVFIALHYLNQRMKALQLSQMSRTFGWTT